MNDFNKLFKTSRVLFLNEINYHLLTLESNPLEVTFLIEDTIKTEMIDNEQLKVLFTRSIRFAPDSLYHLIVSFGLVLTFADDIKKSGEYSQIDYAGYFTEQPQHIGDIISRTSMMIAQITSSHGRPPLITPPNFIKKQ